MYIDRLIAAPVHTVQTATWILSDQKCPNISIKVHVAAGFHCNQSTDLSLQTVD